MRGKDEINRLVAFDFAGTGVRAVAAEVREDNAIKILSEENRKVEGIKNGIIGQPSGTAFNVVALLKELQNSAGMREPIKKFSTAFGGKSMKIIHASVRRKLNRSKEITADIIDSMALECEKSYQTEDMLVYDTIPVMYEVDGVEMEKPEGTRGTYIIGNYHLVVGSAQMKVQLQKCMERIYNCRIEHMPLAAEAFAIAVTEEEDRQAGCAVINMGDSSTTLAVYRKEILQHLMVVPLGGRNITKDIEEIGISEVYAEKLKCKKGIAMEKLAGTPVNIRIPARNPADPPVIVTNTFLAMIIESRLEEIFQPIFSVLQEYEAEIPNGVIISGGAAKLQQMKEFMEQKTGLPTRYGDHTGWLTPDTPGKYCDLSYAQIIGTIILAHDYRTENKEMIEKVEKETRKTRKSIKDKITQGIFKFFEDDTELDIKNTDNSVKDV
ncbi:MAG: cell division protein FtsA [Paludibacter sp.]|nr:cell division protein FtsA [Paludibacter sp.]MDD4198540.1 cell division protein FtsA [Paludibacter sp.]MDD4428166.1 cell division protein FtsA [Paludibacter sp.]